MAGINSRVADLLRSAEEDAAMERLRQQSMPLGPLPEDQQRQALSARAGRERFVDRRLAGAQGSAIGRLQGIRTRARQPLGLRRVPLGMGPATTKALQPLFDRLSEQGEAAAIQAAMSGRAAPTVRAGGFTFERLLQELAGNQ